MKTRYRQITDNNTSSITEHRYKSRPYFHSCFGSSCAKQNDPFNQPYAE
jgi:hypothetical protein